MSDEFRNIAPLLAFLAACPSCPPITDSDKVARCTLLYDQCVAMSENRPEYENCRASVDAQCLGSP